MITIVPALLDGKERTAVWVRNMKRLYIKNEKLLSIWCIIFKRIIHFYADIDSCAPNNPCNNGGECIDEIADFTCKCAEGWTGKTCTASKYQLIF